MSAMSWRMMLSRLDGTVESDTAMPLIDVFDAATIE
jgi:hypothetical protein